MTPLRSLLLMLVSLLGVALLTSGTAAQGPSGSLEVLLASPGQGETFYAAPTGVLTSVPISGRVISYDAPVDLTSVELTLTFIDETGAAVESRVPVGADGYFHIWATINPHNSLPTIEIHEADLCLTCHNFGQIAVPGGTVQLLVHARTPDGLTGSAVRQIRLDRGVFRTLMVQVEGLPEDVQGAQVVASTTIYEWRPRSFYASVLDGRAMVNIEGLSYADLTYQVSLTPVVAGDTRYEAEPQTVVLPAGVSVLSPVTLTARPVRGAVSGWVVDGVSGAGASATILAVDLLTGAARRTMTAEDGAFRLDDLAVSEYALLARSSKGFHLPVRCDLRQAPLQEALIHLTRGGTATLQGTVTLDNQPLPFAQATIPGLATAQADPLSGTFELAAVPAEGMVTVEIAAAGCYGRRLEVQAGDLGSVALTLRPDTTVITRGGSRLYLPEATLATHHDDEITLQQGVLWVSGETGAATQDFVVRIGDYRLLGTGASFAVEAVVGALPRLYVSRGIVTAVHRNGEPVSISAGQALILSGGAARPVVLAPGAGALLRAIGGSVARFELEPPVMDRLVTIAWQVARGIAQLLMLGAYAITFIGMPVLLIGGAAIWLRGRHHHRHHPTDS
ncbi:MAG: carboxypeptidase regulatory-like domain-containing protein [Anaerolineae bacterium]|nr:carboxypeptidase regulatory-like domain-containing protein [Anaerolineae bacterium]